MAERSIDEELAHQAARNAKLVEVIQQHGASLSEKRVIDFFFYTDDRSFAASLATDLRRAGFVNVATGEMNAGKYPVTAERNASVEEVVSPDFVDEVVRLSATNHAEFDGWGTSI